MSGAICVRTGTGKQFNIPFDHDEFVRDIKLRIELQHSFLFYEQRLYCCGQLMRDDVSLRNFDLHVVNFIFLLLVKSS